MVAQRVHAPRLVPRAPHAGAEGRGDEDRHRGHREKKDHERRPVEAGRRGQREAERARPAANRDAVVPVGDADPAIGHAPHDLAERHGDHHEAEPGAAQGQDREDRRGEQRHGEGAHRDPDVAVSFVHDARARVRRDAEEPGVAEAHEPGVAGEHVHAEREDGVEEHLARDVDVVSSADPVRHRGQDRQRDAEGEPAHAAGRPKRPCGRTTSTISMGKNSTT